MIKSHQKKTWYNLHLSTKSILSALDHTDKNIKKIYGIQIKLTRFQIHVETEIAFKYLNCFPNHFLKHIIQKFLSNMTKFRRENR